MQVARYINKLGDDDFEHQYETNTALKSLVSRNNLVVINNHANEGIGTYTDVFEEDMVIARTSITMSVDNAGRPFFNLDVTAVKFDGRDKPLILELLKQKFTPALASSQHNGGELRNPLPEVNLT